MAYGMLVPWPEIEPVSPAMEALSLNHWTTKEVPLIALFVGTGRKHGFKLSLHNPEMSFLGGVIGEVTVSWPVNGLQLATL